MTSPVAGARPGGRSLLRAAAVRVLLLAALWWAVAEGSSTGWEAGVAVVAAATAASLWLHPPEPHRARLTAVPGFLAWFVLRSLAAGVDVARRALARRVDVRPGVLDVPVRVPTGLALVTLADVASLLPGTLGVQLLPGSVRLHVLDTRAPVARQVAELERRVAALYRVDLPER